jgi:hypothetical protein
MAGSEDIDVGVTEQPEKTDPDQGHRDDVGELPWSLRVVLPAICAISGPINRVKVIARLRFER